MCHENNALLRARLESCIPFICSKIVGGHEYNVSFKKSMYICGASRGRTNQNVPGHMAFTWA